MHNSHLKWVLAPVILLAGSQLALSAYTVDIDQAGPDVVATGSGSIDTIDLLNAISLTQPPEVNASNAGVIVGSTAALDFYAFVNGPSSFGSGGLFDADSASGPIVAIGGTIEVIGVPDGYISGDALATSTATWTGTTIAGLGLTPGTYSYTWGTGPDADSFTVNISGAATPLPTAFAGGSAGLLLLAGWAWRQRRGAAIV